MKLSIFNRILLSYPLLKFGITSRRIRSDSKNSFLILMYHRILSPHEVDRTIQPGMYVLGTTFKMHLEFLRRYFSVVHLEKITNGKLQNTEGKPLCAITFDDGWFDFYQYAYPALTELEIPATVFLPTDYISSNKLFWTDRLASLIEKDIKLRTDGSAFPDDVESSIEGINNLDGDFEHKLERAISILKKFPQEIIEQIISKSALAENVSEASSKAVFLTWDQVRDMRQSGLISFGSHTCTHRILTTLDESEIWSELKDSRTKLIKEKACDEEFIPFCYPNGNHNEQIAHMVKEAQYHLAVTTRNEWNKNGSDPFTLKRIGIHNDITFLESLFAYRIANFPW